MPLMAEYLVSYSGGWGTRINADSEPEAKQKGWEKLKLAGHSLPDRYDPEKAKATHVHQPG